MTQCLNPSCLKQNPDHSKFCSYCRTLLLLSDRYRAVKYIGEGAFGRTFLAVDQQRLDSPCVIKQFLPLQQGKAFELFKQEAQLLMNLGQHSQIPDLLAFFEQETRFYLIQQYVEGQDLFKMLLQKKYFSEAEVTDFLLQLLPVLQYIHDHKVIHRDIKLDNIILKQLPSPSGRGVGGEGVMVLIDFGVSKQLSTTIMTKLGTVAGTPGYASPEQMRGLVDNTSDLYALAVCAIRMLTGCLPEEKNGSIVDEIFDIAEFEWVWEKILQQKNMTVSNHLRAILNKMLQDKMKERFQSATEVLQALNNSGTGRQPVTNTNTGNQMPVPPRSSNSKSYTENLGNNITLDLISIPGGTFMMGSNEYDNEKPIHKVTLQPFFMGKYQVTQAQWRVIANRNDLKVKIDLKPDPSYFKGDQRPVEQVNWYEAVEFCDRLSKLTGRQYQLPSEAQWEYACKAVTSHQSPVTKYSFGDDESKLGEYAWYNENSGSQTHPVGQKTPNNFGLYDMHGNVWEWCLDDWHSNYSGAPNDGSAWLIEKDSQYAVLRGGAWCSNYDYCRSAFRFNYFFGRDYHSLNIGFRFVGVGAVRT